MFFARCLLSCLSVTLCSNSPHSMPPEDDVYLDLDHIPEPMRKQNSKPISAPVPELTRKQNSQPITWPSSKPIPKKDPQTSPQPVTQGSTCKLVIGAVVMVAVLAVGIGVGVAVGVLIIAKDGMLSVSSDHRKGGNPRGAKFCTRE